MLKLLSMLCVLVLAACGGQESNQQSAVKAQTEPVSSAPIKTQTKSATSTQDVKKADTSAVAAQVKDTKKAQKVVDALASDAATTEPVKAAASESVASDSAEPAKEAVEDAKAAVVARGDATKGKVLAKRCLSCHSFGTKDKFGPHLKGVFNRAAGKSGFKNYGPELKAADWVWDEDLLLKWVCDSKAAVKEFTGNASARTKMPSQKICGDKANDLVAYLKTL